MLTVQFIGSGDAFGTDGRFQACISLRWQQQHVLVDCGASSLIALKRLGLDLSSVDAICVSHLHGDHFGGIPFLVLDQQFSRRERPLLLAGPTGLHQRVVDAMEVLFPGSSVTKRRFDLQFVELPGRTRTEVSGAEVMPVEVIHPSGAPALGLRIRCGDKILAYSGDTEWTDDLLEITAGADLFVCEAYTYERSIRYHMSYSDLRAHKNELGCKRIILTHVGPDLVANRTQSDVDLEIASDGLQVEV